MSLKHTRSVVLAHAIAIALACPGAGAQSPEPTPNPTPNPAPNPVPPPAPPPAAPAVPAPGSPPAAAAATQLKPFMEVAKDAKATPGFFPLWQKDDKVWIEIAPEQLDKPFFFATSLNQGLGEGFLFGGLMGYRGLIGGSYLATFRKYGNQVQLVARNSEFTAKEGTPEARAVAASFAESLIASAAVVSAPHPERKSFLIEANSLFAADIPGLATSLERAFRQGYAFDARHTTLVRSRTSPDETTFVTNAHYSLARVGLPPIVPGPTPFTPLPTTLQDVRSAFFGIFYSFSKLPEQPMRPRLADPRIGYFVNTRWDYTDDLALSPRVYQIRRWRLEKKDPSAALSEPKQPIVFWLDKNIPVRYRPTITAGIVEWNKAFERIGFKDAVQVKQQPDDADWDTSEVRHASVRWMTTAKPAFGAIGPSIVDPRTGEILDADIGIDVVRLRNARNQRVETINPPLGAEMAGFCAMNEFAAEELGFAMDLLEARGDLVPDSPEAEAFVLADLKDVMMHEVGHTLGLRHNFRASTVYTAQQLADPEFVAKNGLAGSVMEYNARNIALAGHKQGEFSMSTLGPYDYWAVEYGYKEIAPEDEARELSRIAARSNDPLLAYSTDYDAGDGMDPEVNTGDLGQDTLVFAGQRMELAKELWTRWQDRPLTGDASYVPLRRNVSRGLTTVGQVSMMAAKYVGGVRLLRDRAGSPRSPLEPIPAARQREALKIVETGLFSTESFKFKPAFLRRLVADELDQNNAYGTGVGPGTPDFSLTEQVLVPQRAVLNRLMSDTVAQRILESESKLDDPRQAFRLSELYDSLTNSIWAEARTGRESPLLRRNLQREHLARVTGALLRPSPGTPADARGLLRENARTMATQLRSALAKPGLSKETRAHYAESLNTIEEALKAPMQRAGV
jgi:hypothetical protein